MKIEYSINRIDYFIFQLYSILTSKPLWALVTFLCALVGSLSYLEAGENPNVSPALVSIIYVLAILILYFPAMTIWIALLSIFRNGKGILGNHSIELTEVGVIETNESTTSTTKWTGIRKTWRGRRLTAIYISSLTAILVPKSAFRSNDERDKFEEFLMQKLNRATREQSSTSDQ